MSPIQINRRRFSQFMAGTGLGLLNLTTHASILKPEAGKEYRLLSQPQAANAGNKIEVIEFFAYYCHFCHHLEPSLAEWVKKQGDKILFKRIHVLNPGAETQQKLFFALDAIGKADELQNQVFDAYHAQRNRLMTDEQVLWALGKHGECKHESFDALEGLCKGLEIRLPDGVRFVDHAGISSKDV